MPSSIRSAGSLARERREALLLLGGVCLTGLALLWWGCRYLHHPPRLLVAADGAGGSPCICYAPEERNAVFVLLPGSARSASLMLRRLRQAGEDRIHTLFIPVQAEQQKGAEKLYSGMEVGHVYVLPSERARCRWRHWLTRAAYDGAFAQKAPQPMPGWDIRHGHTRHGEPWWRFRTGDRTFLVQRSRGGPTELILMDRGRTLLHERIRSSNRPGTRAIPLERSGVRSQEFGVGSCTGRLGKFPGSKMRHRHRRCDLG